MGSTIRAAVALDQRQVEVREFATPAVEADSGLLRVQRTGVCGSDWPYFLNYPKSKGPMILGHETVGFVAALRPRNSPSSSAHAAKATFPMPANPHTMRKSRWIASSAPPRAGEAEDVFMTRPG